MNSSEYSQQDDKSIFETVYTYERVKGFLENSATDELILLKGHLLIEEILDWRLIKGIGPENHKKLGLTYYKKVILYCGLTGRSTDTEIVDAILRINKIRNNFAHTLGASIKSDLLVLLTDFFREDLPKTINRTSTYHNSLKKLFYAILGMLYGSNHVWDLMESEKKTKMVMSGHQ